MNFARERYGWLEGAEDALLLAGVAVAIPIALGLIAAPIWLVVWAIARLAGQ